MYKTTQGDREENFPHFPKGGLWPSKAKKLLMGLMS